MILSNGLFMVSISDSFKSASQWKKPFVNDILYFLTKSDSSIILVRMYVCTSETGKRGITLATQKLRIKPLSGQAKEAILQYIEEMDLKTGQ